jgi:predicted alpha/beta-fold hydrolase
MRGLVRTATAFAEMRPEAAFWAPAELAALRTVRAYDELIIAPMHGFAGARDYYEAASCRPWLSRIALPTLMVHAEDDPMVPGRFVRAAFADASPTVTVALSPRGGHVAWIGGLSAADWQRTWAITRVIDFFARHV